MEWSDIACIIFVCVTANHLGLIKAVESTLAIRLPIVNCVKCFTWWCVLAYMLVKTKNVVDSLAISFLASYVAIWLELLEGLVDTLYIMLYEKIVTTDTADTVAADTNNGDSASTLSEL